MRALRPHAEPPSRTVVCTDARQWLAEQETLPCVVTSLPDICELEGQIDRGTAGYRAWFEETVRTIVEKLRPGCCALFYQTDSALQGEYISKAHLVMQGGTAAGAKLLWHKVVLKAPPGTVKAGKTAAFSHLLALSRDGKAPPGALALPDVFARGEMAWSRAMGVDAALAACRYVRSWGVGEVCDPFCGSGTVLAAANLVGLNATGVDLSPKRTRHARLLLLAPGEDGRLVPRRSTDRPPTVASGAACESSASPLDEDDDDDAGAHLAVHEGASGAALSAVEQSRALEPVGHAAHAHKQ